MKTKKSISVSFVTVAVVALLTVSFVPHHHHNGFMCLNDRHPVESLSCGCIGDSSMDSGCTGESGHGSDCSDHRCNCADGCSGCCSDGSDHNCNCADGCSGSCAGDCQDGKDGDSSDKSNCVENEIILTSKSRGNGIDFQSVQVPLPIAVLTAYIFTDIDEADCAAQELGVLPPCLYKSANIDGTFSLRAPPFFIA